MQQITRIDGIAMQQEQEHMLEWMLLIHTSALGEA